MDYKNRFPLTKESELAYQAVALFLATSRARSQQGQSPEQLYAFLGAKGEALTGIIAFGSWQTDDIKTTLQQRDRICRLVQEYLMEVLSDPDQIQMREYLEGYTDYPCPPSRPQQTVVVGADEGQRRKRRSVRRRAS